MLFFIITWIVNIVCKKTLFAFMLCYLTVCLTSRHLQGTCFDRRMEELFCSSVIVLGSALSGVGKACVLLCYACYISWVLSSMLVPCSPPPPPSALSFPSLIECLTFPNELNSDTKMWPVISWWLKCLGNSIRSLGITAFLCCYAEATAYPLLKVDTLLTLLSQSWIPDQKVNRYQQYW